MLHKRRDFFKAGCPHQNPGNPDWFFQKESVRVLILGVLSSSNNREGWQRDFRRNGLSISHEFRLAGPE
jgi:hypothetical protein